VQRTARALVASLGVEGVGDRKRIGLRSMTALIAGPARSIASMRAK
jgi:hypothetical protein